MKYTTLVNADNNTVGSGNSIAKSGNVRRVRLDVVFQMFVPEVPAEGVDMHEGPSNLDMGVTARAILIHNTRSRGDPWMSSNIEEFFYVFFGLKRQDGTTQMWMEGKVFIHIYISLKKYLPISRSVSPGGF